MENVIKIYHVVQELRTFSLNGTGQADLHSDYRYSADPRVVQVLVLYWHGFVTFWMFTHGHLCV